MQARRVARRAARRLVLVSAVCVTLSPAPGANAADAGKELFEKRCGGCHALDRERKARDCAAFTAGGRFGRLVPVFRSAEEVQDHVECRDAGRWLTDPEKVVPGNDMAFRVEKAEERAEIIAYLKQNSGK